MAHKYKVGQSVFLRQSRTNPLKSSTRFKIVRLLPPQLDGQNQYRIKGSSEAVERIAAESELTLD
jgi:hypothetical protein